MVSHTCLWCDSCPHPQLLTQTCVPLLEGWSKTHIAARFEGGSTFTHSTVSLPFCFKAVRTSSLWRPLAPMVDAISESQMCWLGFFQNSQQTVYLLQNAGPLWNIPESFCFQPEEYLLALVHEQNKDDWCVLESSLPGLKRPPLTMASGSPWWPIKNPIPFLCVAPPEARSRHTHTHHTIGSIRTKGRAGQFLLEASGKCFTSRFERSWWT